MAHETPPESPEEEDEAKRVAKVLLAGGFPVETSAYRAIAAAGFDADPWVHFTDLASGQAREIDVFGTCELQLRGSPSAIRLVGGIVAECKRIHAASLALFGADDIGEGRLPPLHLTCATNDVAEFCIWTADQGGTAPGEFRDGGFVGGNRTTPIALSGKVFRRKTQHGEDTQKSKRTDDPFYEAVQQAPSAAASFASAIGDQSRSFGACFFRPVVVVSCPIFYVDATAVEVKAEPVERARLIWRGNPVALPICVDVVRVTHVPEYARSELACIQKMLDVIARPAIIHARGELRAAPADAPPGVQRLINNRKFLGATFEPAR